MALGRIRRRSKSSMLPRIQITSLMDMFTIILIFFLFSFGEKVEKIRLQKDLDLPRSNAQTDYAKVIQLVLSKNTLRLEDEVLATLSKGQIPGLDPQNPTQSHLYQRLKAYHENMKNSELAGNGKDERKISHLLFLCDKQHSYKTIYPILKIAGLAGFTDMQFGVLKK